MKPSRLVLIGLALVFLLSTVDISGSFAQVEEEWVAANGTYTGSMAMSGTYTIPFENFGGAGEINWAGAGIGPLEFTISGGFGEGTWGIDGDALINGSLGENQIGISGSQTFGAGGDLLGSFTSLLIYSAEDILNFDTIGSEELSTINLEGEVWSEAEITTTIAGKSSTAKGERLEHGADMWMYYQAASCTQIQGGWIEPGEAALEDAGLRPNLSGTWSVVRDDAVSIEDRSDLQQQIDDLLLESLSLRDQLSSCQQVDLGQLDEFMAQTYAMLDSLNRDMECEFTGNQIRYIYPVTYAACMTSVYYVLSSCENYNTSVDDLSILSMATVGLGCMGQGFFTSDQAVLDAFEGNLQEIMDGLDLTKDEDIVTLAKLGGVGETLGLDDFVQTVDDALADIGYGE